MRNYNKDSIIWVLVISFLGFIGTSLIKRDVEKGFGAVTFGSVPSFELIDQLGNTFSKDDLSDRVWVGSFISPNCESNNQCQKLVNMMTSLSHELEANPNVDFISLRLPPEDKRLLPINQISSSNEDNNWKILHGNAEILNSLASAITQKRIPNLIQEMRFFLVDQNGIIRGYYHSDNLDEVKQLVKDINKLV